MSLICDNRQERIYISFGRRIAIGEVSCYVALNLFMSRVILLNLSDFVLIEL